MNDYINTFHLALSPSSLKTQYVLNSFSTFFWAVQFCVWLVPKLFLDSLETEIQCWSFSVNMENISKFRLVWACLLTCSEQHIHKVHSMKMSEVLKLENIALRNSFLSGLGFKFYVLCFILK
jgi:hypothetical protein